MAKQQEDRERFKRLCADYVLNILGQDERIRFEEMFDEATDEQRELYQKMRTKGNELMFSNTGDPSPEGMRERLLAEVGTGEAPEVVNEPENAVIAQPEEPVEDGDDEDSPVAMGIVVAVVLGFICLSLIFYAFSLRSEMSSQRELIAGQEQAVAELEDEVGAFREMLGVLDSRQLHVVTMLGMEASPFAYGNVLWDAQHKNVLVQVGELPAADSGEGYYFWAIFDNGATLIRPFSVDGEGGAVFMAQNLDAVARDEGFSFAVTLESGDQVNQPNGEMYLMGSFGE